MKTQLWQLLRCCSGSLGCHYSKESAGTEKFVSVAKSCFPSQKGRWVQEPRNGSRNVHTYHHSQDSQGPFGLLCPPSAICSGVSIPSAQRRHTFTMDHRLWGTLAFLRPKVTCWQEEESSTSQWSLTQISKKRCFCFPTMCKGRIYGKSLATPCFIITAWTLGEALTWWPLVAKVVKNLPAMQETWVRSLG